MKQRVELCTGGVEKAGLMKQRVDLCSGGVEKAELIKQRVGLCSGRVEKAGLIRQRVQLCSGGVEKAGCSGKILDAITLSDGQHFGELFSLAEIGCDFRGLWSDADNF